MSIGVPPRAQQVEEEGDDPEHGEHPVEEVEAAGVQAGPVEPPAAARGGVVDHLDEQAAQPGPDAEHAEDDGAADGLDARRRLAGEELEQAEEGGDVHDADREVLRRQQERRHGRGARHGGAPPAAALDRGGRGESGGAGQEAHAHALQVRDAAGIARRAAQPTARHGAVVRHLQDEHLEREGDDEEAPRRDAEGVEAGVHGPALRHGEGEEQRERWRGRS